MYASVRLYRGDPDTTDEVLRRIDTKFLPNLHDLPGFVSYQVIDPGDGNVCTVSIFRDHGEAERSKEMAAEFVRDELADMELERTDVREGEVKISEAAQEVLAAAHV